VDGSVVRAEETWEALGSVDIRLYAAALPYALAGVAAAGCMPHRAVATNVFAVWGLML
jgi:opacity protein-like surface antigen